VCEAPWVVVGEGGAQGSCMDQAGVLAVAVRANGAVTQPFLYVVSLHIRFGKRWLCHCSMAVLASTDDGAVRGV
jgi:hypothetical protein